MPTSLNDLPSLSSYLTPAFARAMHHAPNVNLIAAEVVVCMMTHAQPGTLEGRGDGANANGNMGWFVSKKTGRRYCVCYNHHSRPEMIEIRARNQQGHVVHQLCNATGQAGVHAIFGAL
jgi:hypothetical protein